MNVVYNMDCMEYMRSLPDKAFDLAVVDLDGKMTREEFFALTKNAYGGSIIREAMRAAKEAEA